MGGGNAVWPKLSWLAIRTDRAIHFFHDDGTNGLLPLPTEVQRFELLTVAERRDGGYSLIGYNWPGPTASTEQMFVYTADAAGKFSDPVSVKVTATPTQWVEDYTTEFCGSPVWFAGSRSLRREHRPADQRLGCFAEGALLLAHGCRWSRAGRHLPSPAATLSRAAWRAHRLAAVCVPVWHPGLDRLSLLPPLAGAGDV